MSNFLETITQKIVDYCKVTKNYCTMKDMEQYVDSYLPGFRETVIQEYIVNHNCSETLIQTNLPDIETTEDSELDNLELNKKFRMEIEVGDGDQYQLWGVDDPQYNYNGTIDWGDGTVETFTTYNPSHTYTTAGIYEIAISDKFDALYNASSSNTSVHSVRKILSWGDGTVFEGFRDLQYGFYHATGLTEIASDTYGGLSKNMSFNYCFYYCSSLTAIPAGLFDNCPNVTSFNSCFYYCESLTAIPAGLFDNCPNVTDFNHCFGFCSKLTAIPAGLFDNCTNVTSFYYCFYNCSSLTAIPACLFDNCTNVTGFDYCFYNCNNLVLGGDEFTLLTLAGRTINFGYCFQVQSTSYQEDGTAPQLWKDGLLSASSTTTGCFRNRTKLTNYSSIPPKWK